MKMITLLHWCMLYLKSNADQQTQHFVKRSHFYDVQLKRGLIFIRVSNILASRPVGKILNFHLCPHTCSTCHVLSIIPVDSKLNATALHMKGIIIISHSSPINAYVNASRV